MVVSAENRKTVLVAEDNGDDLYLLGRWVRKAACPLNFRFVQDGERAIAYMKGEAPYEDRQENPFPDLVLLDLQLPRVSGFEVLEWIRATPGCAELKVMVWSGWDRPDWLKQLKALVPNVFVAKSSEGFAKVVASISQMLA